MSLPLLVAEALRTRKQSNIGLWRQFWQICRLRFGPGKLDPWEYFFFRVFLDRYTAEQKQRFVGWRGEILLDRLANPAVARNLANDKLAFHNHLVTHGIPVPKIEAVYGGTGLKNPETLQLGNRGQLNGFLGDTGRYPLFVKPVRGAQGKNAYALLAVTDNGLQMLSGERVKIADFISRLERTWTNGILFQELLGTSPQIAAICGQRLTSVRFIVIVTPEGPEILSAVWRVPTGTNVTDNFDCGRSGNIIAGIDLETGQVRRIVRGFDWKNIPVDCHPDTGVSFGQLLLPDWESTRAMCLKSAALIPNLRLQHWDIALTDRGPVVMEVNVEGGMRTHQIVRQTGILDDRLRRLAESGTFRQG